ncbi:MAG: DUF4258 domain-containing protein [Ignavibacteriales bacterium]|nr:MAG: DUF4258 domain-containing protein [Ignavibacteriales bacterium]
MLERDIDEKIINTIVKNGKVISSYNNDKPYPSKLLLGFAKTKPIHVVAADNLKDKEVIIITVYEPDPLKWDSNFERKL